jgi:hypothetical protein
MHSAIRRAVAVAAPSREGATTAIVTRKEMRRVEIQTYNAPVVSGVVD